MLNYRSKNYFKISFVLFAFLSTFSFAQVRTQKPTKFPVEAKAGSFIDVNIPSYPPSSFTPTQLVTDILVGNGGGCVVPNISNVTVSPNTAATVENRAWGYFHKGTANFPFTDGIVLSTGFARKAGNVAEVSMGDNNQGGGDADLSAAIGVAGLNNASVLEFDFVPTSSQMKFNYIFASHEYDSDYPCPPFQFDDAFALLLKPNTPGSTYTNLAVLPGGAGLVAVTNIVPDSFSCGPLNAQFFGSMLPNGTNYNGRTIPLTAEATVIPGQSYHIKMVIADARDTIYDSAVFLEAGSFNIGVSIVDPAGNPVPETLYVCDNTPQILKALVTTTPGMTFQWFKDGVAIPGATNVTYTAVGPGVYTVKIIIQGQNCPAEAKVTIVGGTSPIIQNATLKLCATPSNSTFNLDSAKPSISTTPGAVFKFYLQQADAVLGNNSNITGTTAFNGTDGQVIYVNVSNGAFCSRVAMLTLRREETPVATLTAPKIKICNGESVVLTAAGGVTYQWGDNSASGAIRTVSPTATTTYTVYAIGAQGCKSLTPASITIEVVPAITSTLTGGWICNGDTITLDAGAGPNYAYQWSNGATTQTITVGVGGTYGVTISNGVCTKLFTTEVKIAVPPTITNINYANDNITISVSNPSNGALEYSLDNGLTWQNSNVFTNVPKNKLVFIQVRVKTTSCVGYLEYYTFNMQNVITPNGDNVNDIIDFRGVAGNKNFTAQVSDRYGRVVYRYEKIRPYWDGFFQGKKLSTSSYWYQITFEDPASKQTTVKTGWILLKNIE
ncbi:gliding motility-associated C-terminal domain-containing protein [Chryseobacterium foetidum]|uniref:gliding motility-associated C-terminal domain-containing protein n=1 Tax=Chryseobacterium foetidum TaxID=2951057 RepID=UPI0021C634CD|nr:gliding motility-associated C-terminal domain-containing protein [Chryseobacterium foetidum]